MKNITKTLAAGILALSLAGCGSNDAATTETTAPAEAGGTLSVMCTANPHGDILEAAKPILKEKYNIDLDIQISDDYYIQNEAVSNGDVDANFYQHVPFFEESKETNGFKISNVGGVHIEPFGIYSKSITDVADIPDGAKVIISNSVADNGRILSILADAGLVTLPEGTDELTVTIADIDNEENNPKGLVFEEIKPELTPTAYENGEGDLVAINGNYALQAGLSPANDALILEEADESNPYVNIVVCQEGHEEDPNIVALVEVLQSDEIKDFITEKWPDGSVLPVNN